MSGPITPIGNSFIGRSLSAPMAQISGTVAAAAADESWFDSLVNTARGIFGLSISGTSPAGCLSEGPTVQELLETDGGVPIEQPPVPDGGEVTDSGATIVDGSVYLPVDDAGNPILPGDIWFELEGQGSFFVTTPLIPFGSDDQLVMEGSGLQNMNLQVQIGTDSTLILDPDMPADGCFPGLINVLPADEFSYCETPGYEVFANCPQNEGFRIPVYMGNYTAEFFRRVSSNEIEFITASDHTFSTVEELYADPASGTLLGTFCTSSNPPISIPIPPEALANGQLYVRLTFDLIAPAQGAPNNPYRTIIGVRVHSQ